jgi:class 3 adenylate cyclase
VFFSDIKGFSGLGELLTATTLVKLLNTYFSQMTTLIHARNGIKIACPFPRLYLA